ncbi:MAG: hypothetical protein BWK80_19000 [Desulfobacteraceae bacterium IS3]|nr:MAG: hypothetical protein BWK80_19000 [Desulfobacteraceae bacterium IS3]
MFLRGGPKKSEIKGFSPRRKVSKEIFYKKSFSLRSRRLCEKQKNRVFFLTVHIYFSYFLNR